VVSPAEVGCVLVLKGSEKINQQFSCSIEARSSLYNGDATTRITKSSFPLLVRAWLDPVGINGRVDGLLSRYA